MSGGPSRRTHWDIRGNGTFADLFGPSPTLAWSAFPFAPGSYTISLETTDVFGLTSTAATAALDIVNYRDFAVFSPFGGRQDSAQGPEAGLIQGTDGKLYGTTRYGGTDSGGTVYRINADGTGFVVLHYFNYLTDGGTPMAGLIQGTDGRLYGTTSQGGSQGYGTIFAMAADGAGFTVLRSLAFATDGGNPQAGLVQGSDGRLYGTTYGGGVGFSGTIFAIRTDGTGFTVRLRIGWRLESDSGK